MKRVIILLFLLLTAAGCALPLTQNNAPQDNSDALEKVARDYATWPRMFDAPRNVSMQLMLLCRTMNDDEQAYIESEHAQYFVQVFVNPLGEKMMRVQDTLIFPEGTIIVKEKWKRDDSFAQDATATKPAGLGIMLKEKSSWQYAYVDETGNITRDQKQLEHCAACHNSQSERDSVFFPQVLSQ